MRLKRLCLFVLLIAGTTLSYAGEIVRLPIGSGPLYPESPQTLLETLDKLFNQATPPDYSMPLKACIVPHDGYGLSGAVAAHAFKYLKPGQFERVIVLGGARYVHFDGCSMPEVKAYLTPLGYVPLDKEAVQLVSRSPLFSIHDVSYTRRPGQVSIHEKEPSIELVLPFLQQRLGKFKLVPILVGNLKDSTDKFNVRHIEVVADTLQKIIDDKTLLVVSAEFTHFGNDFSFRPFTEDIFENIERIDSRLFDYILEHDVPGLHHFIAQNHIPVIGEEAIEVLLKLLPHYVGGQVLAHELSGRSMKNEKRSISYAAINFYDARGLNAVSQTSKEPPREIREIKLKGASVPQETPPEE